MRMWGSAHRRRRLMLRGSLAAGVCALVAALLAPAALAGSVSVTLSQLSASPIGQGARYKFKVQVQNTGTSTVTVTVKERLTQTSSGGSVDFGQDQVTVAPGLTKTYNRGVVTSQYYAEIGTYQITPFVNGVQGGNPLQFDVAAPTVTVPVFQDVTAASGLTTTGSSWTCEPDLAAGAAWGDVDGDGDLDLYVPLDQAPARLFINNGAGHFTDHAAAFGVTNAGSEGRGAVMADYDNDGREDIYVVNTGPNRLYHNDGGGTFSDVTAVAGVGDDGFSTSAAFGDYDNDGFLDLYVTDYGSCTVYGQITAQPDKLYHNEGDGTFTDQTALVVHDPESTADGTTLGWGFQAAWWDYDGDGDQDLYLANDIHDHDSPYPNVLWRNDGPTGPGGTWQFTDVSVASGAGLDINSMGIGISDWDNDGDLDMAISDIAGNKALRNNGNGTFTEVAKSIGVARPYVSAGKVSITWGLAFFDFNLDGREDLYVAGGPLKGLTYAQPNQLFVGASGGQFLDLSAPSGSYDEQQSRGVAFADYDRDGRVDMYVVDQNGTPILYRNVTSTPTKHWIEVDTVGTVSNRDGCGARLVVTIGTLVRVREVFCGSVSLSSGSDPTVHVGVGGATTIDKIEITWPSGIVQVLTGVAADQMITVTEPAA